MEPEQSDPAAPPHPKKRLGTIAVLDVGETYVAAFIAAPQMVSPPSSLSAINSSDGTPPVVEVRFKPIHWAIDEFQEGLAPYQPILSPSSSSGTAGTAAGAGGATLSAPPHVAKRKEKKLSKAERGPRGRKARKPVAEAQIASMCGNLVQRYMNDYGIRTLYIEHQLDNARRNVVVECSLVAAATAAGLGVKCLDPMLKFVFHSPEMQKMGNGSMRSADGNLKAAAKLIMENALRACSESVHPPTSLAVTQDLRLVDMGEMVRLRNTTLDQTHTWYQKDLADAFLLALYAAKLEVGAATATHSKS